MSTKHWTWLIWIAITALWAVALLTPEPVEYGQALLGSENMFGASKTLHVCAYAFLAASAAWLPAYRGMRWMPLLLLSLHGCATEFFQQFVEGRHGCLEDVAIDHFGIALGFIASFWRWRRG